MNKKGTELDFILPIVYGFIFLIILYVAYHIITSVTSTWTIAEGVPEAQNIQTKVSNAKGLFDSLFVMFFFGSIFAIGVMAYLIRTNSIFLFGLWLLSNVFIIVAYKLAQVFSSMRSGTGLFADVSSNFTMSNFLFDHIALFFFLSSTIIVAIMYGIGRQESEI